MVRAKPSMTDFLYEQVLNRILSGDYAPNMRIPAEEDIAREFDLSRPVVRNALARLKREGVLESRRGSGTVVKEGAGAKRPTFGPVESVEDVWYCFEFRIQDLARMEAALERLKALKSTDMLEMVNLDIAFHQAVVAATHNRFMIGTYDTWLPQIHFSCTMSANLSQARSALRQKQVVHGHDKIVHCIRHQDGEGAREAMIAHLTAARQTVFRGRLIFGNADGEPGMVESIA
jgi:GntR family transcriptional repressor for pyruvate dehydrogenase complex